MEHPSDLLSFHVLLLRLLSSEDIEGEAVEAADDRLLNVQAQRIQRTHGGQQQPRPPAAEHVDVQRPPFSYLHIYLQLTTSTTLVNSQLYIGITHRSN